MPVGRPPKYKTPEEMQIAIDEFFELCKPSFITDNDGNLMTDRNNKPVMQLNPPTITGLALHLGFCDRRSMYDYENVTEFSHTIRNARTRCENYAESAGLSGSAPPAMAIFVLKNYGWTDKQEIEHSGETKVDIIYQPVKVKE